MKPRGVLCEFLVDVCRREILTLSAANTLKAYKWEYLPRLEVFVFISSIYELFDFASQALFCGLEVWQDFIRVAVLVLLSLGTNLVTKPYRQFTVQQL